MLAKAIEVDLENSVSDSVSSEARLQLRREERRGKSSKSVNLVDNNLDGIGIVADKRKANQEDSRVLPQRIGARSSSKQQQQHLANELALTSAAKANKQTARGCSIEIDKWPEFSPALKGEAFQLPHCSDIDSGHDIVATNVVSNSESADIAALSSQDALERHLAVEEISPERSISLIGCHLLTLICGLLLLLYLFDVGQRFMTNLLSKILGGERRRSLANNAQQQQQQQHRRQQQQEEEDPQLLRSGIAQSHSSSTLSLPRNSSPIMAPPSQRRSSRSSIHSVSALFISAFTGGGSSSGSGAGSGQASMNNGNSLFFLFHPLTQPKCFFFLCESYRGR